MFLERIELDAWGALRATRIGPFAPGMNAVFGADGAGKTTAVRLIRELLSGDLPTGRQPTRGTIRWRDARGAFRARYRPLTAGQFERTVEHRALAGEPPMAASAAGSSIAVSRGPIGSGELPVAVLRCLLAMPSGETFAAEQALQAAEQVGLTFPYASDRNAREVTRLEARLQELDRQLSTIVDGEHRGRLEERRRWLRQEIGTTDHVASAPADPYRLDRRRMSQRLDASRDEQVRLERQCEDLRRALSELDVELLRLDANGVPGTRYAIATAHRDRLEEIDKQLLRWRRTLRELHVTRQRLDQEAGDLRFDQPRAERLVTPDLTRAFHTPLAPQSPVHGVGNEPLHSLERRLADAQWQLDRLAERLASQAAPANKRGATTASSPVAMAVGESYPQELRLLRDDLRGIGRTIHGQRDAWATGRYGSEHAEIERCEGELLHAIDRLISQRTLLMQEISRQHGLPVEQLQTAFGDWSHCQDQPHLYQWLLSDQCPPQAIDAEATAARRRHLESERSHFLAELHHSSNRLVEVAREVEMIRGQFRNKDEHSAQPAVHDRLRCELAEVERQLSDTDRKARLAAERTIVVRQLADAHALPRVSGPLHEAAQLLARLTANRLSSLQRVDQRLLVNDRPLQELVLVDQEIVALAVRMACIRTLSNTLGPIPLVIDEAGLIEDASRLVEVLQEFARHDHQVLLFTSRRDVLDRVNAAGGWCGYLERTSRAVVIETPEAPVSVLEYVNRALDVAWREDHDLAYEPRLLHEPARKPGAARADRTGPLRRSSPIAHAPAMHGRWGTALHAIGIKQVGDLLDAHPTAVVRRLQGAGRSGAGRTDAPISSARVRRWQDAARLMCQQPKLRAFDALVLSGCGMRDAAMLQATSPSELADRVEAFLSTGLGRQVLRSGSRFEVARITEWLQSLRRQRGSNAVDGQNPDWHHLAPTQQKPSTNAAPRRAAHLRRESPVERAPTIGPSMARRLNKVGVQTVADLLSAAPEDLAKRLGAPQIAPRVIRQWQAQATLVCQVPGLRGHAAQLLVAAGVTTPNDLARAQAGGLYEAIVKQSKSAAGQRYLRGREAPSREEVTQWVRLAQTRKPRAA